MNKKSGTSKDAADTLVKNVRRKTHRLHPFAQRLTRNLEAVIFLELLCGKGGAKVDVIFANQRHRELLNCRIDLNRPGSVGDHQLK